MKQFSCSRKVLSIMLMLVLSMGLVQFSVPLTAYAATSYTAGTYNELATAISAANDGDTINITADIVVNAQLTIASSVTINGNDHTISVPQPGLLESGLLNPNGSRFCVFFIDGSGKTVTLNDMTLYGGVYGEQVAARSNRYFGGAVVVKYGRLNLYNSTVSRSGGVDAISGNQCAAGGICNEANGVVFISNCNFSRNAASFGGSFVNYGKMFIENSTFSENRSLSSGGGGGAGQNNGTLYINNSTLSNNNSTELGGAINDLSTAYTYILNSTFTGNVSYNSIYGGGALRGSSNTAVINCLFAYNYDYVGGTLNLNDIAIYYGGYANTSSYYSMYQSINKSGTGNMRYNGNMNGSDNSLFAGGIYTKVMAADGTELNVGQVYRPFLCKPTGTDTSVIPLKTGSQALGGGCDTAFFADPGFPEVGYYNGSTSSWQMITGAHNTVHEVTTDQTGTARVNAVGATELLESSLHMVKLKYYDAATYGPVSGISIYGDNYMSGANATISANPNSGYLFREWKNVSDDSTFSDNNPYTFNVTSDVYIYPTFEAGYTITFDGNGSTGGSMAAQTIANGGNFTIPSNTFTKTGSIFNGWAASGATTGSYGDGDTINNVTGNITLTAQWLAVNYSISASPLTSFGSHETPYSQPAEQTVTVTNTGNQSVTLSQPTSTNYIIGTLSSTSLPTNGSTATFTIQPKAGLGVGNHDETIALNGSNGATTTIDAEFIVTSAAPVYTISASPLTSFGSHETPYSQPAEQTVTVTNTGNQSVTLSQPASINYIIGTLSSTSLPANGSTVTFTVQPKAGLGVGNHDETIAINGNNGATTSVGAQFIVTAAAPAYTISASSLSSFGSLAAPYIQPAAQTVTVTNTGNQSVTLSQPTSTNYIIGALSSTSLPANGSTVTFTVQPKAGLGVGNHDETIAINGSNGATTTVDAQFIVTAAHSSDNETDSTPTAPSAPPASGVDIIVNGNRVNAGTASDSTENGRSVTTVTVDQQKLERKLAIEGNNALVIIPIDSDSDKMVGRLNGRMIKDMEERQATLELRTKSAAYTLPASEINIDAVSAQLGKNLTLSDIIVLIEIASPTDRTATAVKSAARNGGFSLGAPAVDFNISCVHNGKTVDLSTFNTYVERTVAIPEGVDPAKITTGVVVNPDGTVRHVPTKVTQVDGRYHAVIKSLTNSTYAIIWHPVKFSDMGSNWAKASVNDMGSRMVIEGVGNNKYAPNRFITRAEFAAIVVRALGLPPGTGSNDFRDVGSSKWYCGYIKTASAYGIIQGYNTTAFGPDDRVTREQAMTMIARAMKITGLKPEMKDSEINPLLSRYSDGTAVSDFARTSIAACLKTGIITGRSSSAIAPKDFITRAEVAVIVQRLLQKSGLI